jgi:hypothetical protein
MDQSNNYLGGGLISLSFVFASVEELIMLNYMITRDKQYQDAVRAGGLLYAATGTLTNGVRVVIIMPELDSAPKYVQDFVLKHEEGHIIYGDNDEYAADKHAAHMIGNKIATKALWWLFKDSKGKASYLARLEAINRIFNIKYGRKVFNINRNQILGREKRLSFILF